MKAFTVARCTFYLREPGQRGGFQYTNLNQQFPPGEGLPTTMPPQIGDLVGVGTELFRVVNREWSYPAPGSMYWPSGQGPSGPTNLTLMVERAEGMFIDEEAAT
ncbi:hypothetical protein [Streptosporangium lutulentum]|uniref:Uncharacterized protein n=1 Tax=Streptosporangium lutulentum TaxID=1461250 RepID=A0ABT9Q959_9ACTN|nr:hypothetical protein [Streptosporangium lutulentum]MDP9843285.1 hypothetical protein [Streptosporangium lutulentum]